MPINLNMMDHGIFGPLIRKGRAQGMEEGLKKGQFKLLLKQAERRFGPLPRSLRNRIEALDLAGLECAGLRLLEATSPEDILAR